MRPNLFFIIQRIAVCILLVISSILQTIVIFWLVVNNYALLLGISLYINIMILFYMVFITMRNIKDYRNSKRERER